MGYKKWEKYKLDRKIDKVRVELEVWRRIMNFNVNITMSRAYIFGCWLCFSIERQNGSRLESCTVLLTITITPNTLVSIMRDIQYTLCDTFYQNLRISYKTDSEGEWICGEKIKFELMCENLIEVFHWVDDRITILSE